MMMTKRMAMGLNQLAMHSSTPAATMLAVEGFLTAAHTAIVAKNTIGSSLSSVVLCPQLLG